jgi:hypothetical protein
MAFDAKQAVTDKLTVLEDDLKQAKAREVTEAKRNAADIAAIEAEIAGWQSLLSEPAAKKTSSKK